MALLHIHRQEVRGPYPLPEQRYFIKNYVNFETSINIVIHSNIKSIAIRLTLRKKKPNFFWKSYLKI